jgi:uncharacterized membrane protein YphA (DoxX/SURF4 family)
MLLSIILVVYNITVIDFQNPFGDESIISAITILAGLCAILILAILLTSKKIAQTLKQKS